MNATKGVTTAIHGTSIFVMSRAPMKKGLKAVVRRYVELISKLEIDARFPVAKNAALMQNRKSSAQPTELGLGLG